MIQHNRTMKYGVRLEVVFEEAPDNQGIMPLAGLAALKMLCRQYNADIKELSLIPKIAEQKDK